MPTRVYVVARVPAASRDAAEIAVQPLQISPNEPGAYTFSVPLVPLAGPAGAEPTAYGCCTPFLSTNVPALSALASAFPGASYSVIDPWRSFSPDTHWTAWLTTAGLQVRQEVAVAPL